MSKVEKKTKTRVISIILSIISIIITAFNVFISINPCEMIGTGQIICKNMLKDVDMSETMYLLLFENHFGFAILFIIQVVILISLFRIAEKTKDKSSFESIIAKITLGVFIIAVIIEVYCMLMKGY